MTGTRKKLLFAAFFAAMPACSLFVSVDDLQGGSAATGDASTQETSTSDGAIESSPPADSGSGDAGADANGFLDDFNRADDALLGNGWIEKTPSAFTLSGNEVLRVISDGGLDYPDNIVYRPSAEDVRDTEISAEVVFINSIGSYPQIHARIQEATVGTPGTLDSYILYISQSANTAFISRTTGAENLDDLATITISPDLVVGQRYRLRLRVIGANPVTLDGIVEMQNGSTWQKVGESATSDTGAAQLVNAGSVGFSGSDGDNDPYTYDNFTRTNL